MNTCEQLELPNIIDHKIEARLSDWRLEITYDDWAKSPRTYYENLGMIFVPKGCKYAKNEFSSDWDSVCDSGSSCKDKEKLEKMGLLVYPLSVYDHSGVSLFIGGSCDMWDSGQIGWYLVNKIAVYERYGCKRITSKLRADIRKQIISEIEEYSDWYMGENWEYKLFKGDELFDSCSGFIGSNHDRIFDDMWKNIPSEFTDAFTKEEAKAMAEEKGLWFSY